MSDHVEMHDFGDGKPPIPAHRHSNGGGWIADESFVSPDVYVSADSAVRGTRFRFEARPDCPGKARIQGGVLIDVDKDPWVQRRTAESIVTHCQITGPMEAPHYPAPGLKFSRNLSREVANG